MLKKILGQELTVKDVEEFEKERPDDIDISE